MFWTGKAYEITNFELRWNHSSSIEHNIYIKLHWRWSRYQLRQLYEVINFTIMKTLPYFNQLKSCCMPTCWRSTIQTNKRIDHDESGYTLRDDLNWPLLNLAPRMQSDQL